MLWWYLILKVIVMHSAADNLRLESSVADESEKLAINEIFEVCMLVAFAVSKIIFVVLYFIVLSWASWT